MLTSLGKPGLPQRSTPRPCPRAGSGPGTQGSCRRGRGWWDRPLEQDSRASRASRDRDRAGNQSSSGRSFLGLRDTSSPRGLTEAETSEFLRTVGTQGQARPARG